MNMFNDLPLCVTVSKLYQSQGNVNYIFFLRIIDVFNYQWKTKGIPYLFSDLKEVTSHVMKR